MSQAQNRESHPRKKVSFDDHVTTNRLEAAVRQASKRTQEYEDQMRSVESDMSTTLSNFRAIDSMMREAYTGIEQHNLRANRALDIQVPYIDRELEESEKSLVELDVALPAVNSQVAEIRAMYDSGRKEVRYAIRLDSLLGDLCPGRLKNWWRI
ncbi:hypothetical protein AX17_004139 [Amanita inopinata Kibby_2008]|nr:hypothetical protein AX17_004139 [Amanita inopinata Kibby_2008]